MAKALLSKSIVVLSLGVCAAAASGCGAAVDRPGGSSSGLAPGAVLFPGVPKFNEGIPEDGNTITISTKYVVLLPDASTAASPSQAEVQELLSKMSQEWSQCGIRFALDQYVTRVADQDNLIYHPANQSDLDSMRAAYDDKKHAVYVKTGAWDRSGDLGNDGSNGFSSVPPNDAEGTVIEEKVQANVMLMAHETGHLLGGLEHVNDESNLMDHFVMPTSTALDNDQCNQTRTAIQQYHQAWVR